MAAETPAVIWLTGLSAAGKTTIAHQLMEKFKTGPVPAVLLDGDEVRKLTGETGYDEASRIRHNLRVGQMASDLEREGKVVVVALISPYAETREKVRIMCSRFIEVYVSTSLELCMLRDPKGLYKKALAGEIELFTGISAPYDIPANPEIIIDTNDHTAEDCAARIYQFYRGRRSDA